MLGVAINDEEVVAKAMTTMVGDKLALTEYWAVRMRER